MGLAKRMMMTYQEKGDGSSDKIICHECVGDYYLKKYIKDNGSRNRCDYCGKSRKCIKLEDLMEPIMDGIRFEYEDATDCMSWDSKEGGFIGANTWDNYDLIHDKLWEDLGVEDGSLLDDIANLIEDSITWCPGNPYFLCEYDEDYYIWESFSNQLKHNIRYVFFMAPLYENDNYARYNNPSDILETIGKSISSLD